MNSGGDDEVKLLRTPNGLQLSLDDTVGSESLMIETRQGNRITIQGGSGSVTVADSNGNSILLGPGGIEITTSSKLTINANEVVVDAASMEVNCPTVKFPGVVTADTLIANSVVSNSYTPGAGNIW